MGFLLAGLVVLGALTIWIVHGYVDQGPPQNSVDRNVPGATTGAGQNSLINKPGTVPK
jgi:hypothetical protein